MKKLSIIVPVHNEKKTLRKIIERLMEVALPNNIKKEVIIIDDESSDSSSRIIKDLSKKYKNIRYLMNKVNKGKSRTVKRGIQNSTGDYIIIQDADLEYDPKDISTLVSYALENKLKIVYGNRFSKKSKIVYIENYIGNRILSFISNIFTYPRLKVWIPDMEVCYKLIRGDIARSIARNLKAKSNFGFEPEMTARLSKYKINGKHINIGVVPISYSPRTKKEGKHMKAFRDGLKALKEIFIYNAFN